MKTLYIIYFDRYNLSYYWDKMQDTGQTIFRYYLDNTEELHIRAYRGEQQPAGSYSLEY